MMEWFRQLGRAIRNLARLAREQPIWPLCIIRTQIHGSDDDRLGFRRRSIGMAVAPEYIREPHRQHPAIPITKRPARWPAIVLGEDA